MWAALLLACLAAARGATDPAFRAPEEEAAHAVWLRLDTAPAPEIKAAAAAAYAARRPGASMTDVETALLLLLLLLLRRRVLRPRLLLLRYCTRYNYYSSYYPCSHITNSPASLSGTRPPCTTGSRCRRRRPRTRRSCCGARASSTPGLRA